MQHTHIHVHTCGLQVSTLCSDTKAQYFSETELSSWHYVKSEGLSEPAGSRKDPRRMQKQQDVTSRGQKKEGSVEKTEEWSELSNLAIVDAAPGLLTH